MNTDPRSDDELNRIIAEWIGWSPLEQDELARAAWYDITGADVPTRPPPYCTDLNAIHEAERKLTDKQIMDWGKIHADRSFEHRNDEPRAVLAMFSPTARQRAEALVKVIEEGKQQ